MSHQLVGHPPDKRRTTYRIFPPDFLFETVSVALDALLCSPKKALPQGMLPRIQSLKTFFSFLSLGISGLPFQAMRNIRPAWSALLQRVTIFLSARGMVWKGVQPT